MSALLVMFWLTMFVYLGTVGLAAWLLNRSAYWSVVFAALANVTVCAAVVLSAVRYGIGPSWERAVTLAVVPTWFVGSGSLLVVAIREYRRKGDLQRRVAVAKAAVRSRFHPDSVDEAMRRHR